MYSAKQARTQRRGAGQAGRAEEGRERGGGLLCYAVGVRTGGEAGRPGELRSEVEGCGGEGDQERAEEAARDDTGEHVVVVAVELLAVEEEVVHGLHVERLLDLGVRRRAQVQQHRAQQQRVQRQAPAPRQALERGLRERQRERGQDGEGQAVGAVGAEHPSEEVLGVLAPRPVLPTGRPAAGSRLGASASTSINCRPLKI